MRRLGPSQRSCSRRRYPSWPHNPAFAAIETRVVVGGPYTIRRGAPTIIALVDCTDSETGSDLRPAATLKVKLTQRHGSVTRVKEFQCWGDDDIVIGTFRGFHPESPSSGRPSRPARRRTWRTAPRPPDRPEPCSSAG